MLTTSIGNFPIGFRRGWTPWQNDADALIAWATSSGLSVIDPTGDGEVWSKQAIKAGLKIGTVDFPNWSGLLSPDRQKRRDAVAQGVEHARACAAAGATRFFIVMLPEKPELPRAENFAFMVDSLQELAPHLEKIGACLSIEGWPGPGALCCTPETYRATFKAVPSKSIGINYDPSHLIRMGIDPIRFLEEFVDRVVHVHGKDTAIKSDDIYEYGTEVSATFAKPYSFGGNSWRYTIPGNGLMRWSEAFSILAKHDYQGCVSIELEDGDYHGSETKEKEGILAGARHLAKVSATLKKSATG